MTRQGILAVLIFASLTTAGCRHARPVSSDLWIDPGEAVLRAAAARRAGVTGVFAMTVKATGRTDKVHLNSEADYRDPRNLSVAVMPAAAAELEKTLGSPPDVFLRGRRILVAGTARTVRIDFVTEDGPSGKYYYQTHVRVDDASQIRIL